MILFRFLPIYVDKPIALNSLDLSKIFLMSRYERQIFTCSALVYSKKLDIPNKFKSGLNENFSIIRIPIKERNGRPKILNNGVKEITFIRFGFFEISNRTSLRDPKYEFICLEFLLWSFS